MTKYLFNCICLTVVLTAAIAQGDVLVLNNGEKLIGKVITLIDGKLIFQSEFAGKVNIDIKNIKSIETDEPVDLHIADVPVKKNPVIEPLVKWSGNLKVGLSSAHGNTYKGAGNVSVSVKRKTKKSNWTSNMRFLLSRGETTDGEQWTNEENITFASKYDRYYNKKDYVFLNGSYKKDHIADLDRRVIIGFGVGRKWIDTTQKLFSTDFGLALRHEMFKGANDYRESEDALSAQLSYKVTHKFSKTIELLHKTFYFPSYEQFSDYYLTSSLELKNKFTGNLFGSFIVLLDYDATPAETAGTTDTKYLFNLGYTF